MDDTSSSPSQEISLPEDIAALGAAEEFSPKKVEFCAVCGQTGHIADSMMCPYRAIDSA